MKTKGEAAEQTELVALDAANPKVCPTAILPLLVLPVGQLHVAFVPLTVSVLAQSAGTVSTFVW